MKIRIITTIAFFQCFCSLLSAQKLADANWVGGFEEYPQVAGYANYIIRFQPSGVVVDTLNLGIKIESTTASISDSSGQLLFFTNGCVVADANGQILNNGEGVNPGPMHDWVCDKTGYIVQKGAMILPVPDSPNLFYLFHLGAEYETPTALNLGPFYYTVIDGTTNSIASKNNVLLSGKLEPFSVVRHGNGRDWWILMPEWGTDKIHIFLFGSGGISDSGIQETGVVMDGKRVGATTFSLDGSRYARFHADQGVFMADFDRCSGLLGNFKVFPTPFPLLLGGGVAFSPNSQKIYAASQSAFYEIDLVSTLPAWDTLFYLYDNYTWGTTLHQMQYGPDSKLYLNTHSRADYLNALTFSTNGAIPSFQFKSLPLRVKNARSLPHFPNFRLYDLPNSPCDTLGINTPVSASEPVEKELKGLSLYPNPATNQVSLVIDPSWTSSGEVQYQIINAFGSLLRRGEVPKGSDSQQVGLNGLPSGVYFFQVTKEGKTLGTAKLVILQR